LLMPEQETFICNVIKAFSTRANPLVAGDVLLLAQVVAGLQARCPFAVTNQSLVRCIRSEILYGVLFKQFIT